MTLLRALALGALASTIAACGDDEPATPTPPPPPPPAATDAAASDGAAGDAAATAADAASDGGPSKTDAHSGAYRQLAIGRSLAGQEGREADAASAFRKAQEAAPEVAFIRAELAAACLAAGDAECAATEARAAADGAQGDPLLAATAKVTLARALEKTGNSAGARDAYVESLRLHPSRSVAERVRVLAGGSADAGSVEEAVVSCGRTRPEDDPALAAASARGAPACPLAEAPYQDREPGGIISRYDVFATLTPHGAAPALVASEGGLGAAGSFSVLLTRVSRGRPQVLVLDNGQQPGRQNEIVRELSAEMREITLGPSRQALVVEVVTRGFWGVDAEETAYPFERNELFVVHTHIGRPALAARQVTRETGWIPSEDCLRNAVAGRRESRGTVWLEDIDLSGVPEICQETLDPRTDLPEWLGTSELLTRTEATCHGWVASDLRRMSSPVPSIHLDDMERERSIHQVLEMSRVPVALHNGLRRHLGAASAVTGRSMQLTTTGMHGMAVVVTDTQARALAISASDAVNAIDLGEIGAWTAVTASIDVPEPEIITVELTVVGGQPDGYSARSWLFAIASSPGVPPVVALRHETASTHELGHAPCPQATTAEVERRTEDGVRFFEFTPTRRTGPGTHATEQAREALCQQVSTWSSNPDGSSPGADAPPTTPEGVCPVGSEELESALYVQGSDRRFTPVILP